MFFVRMKLGLGQVQTLRQWWFLGCIWDGEECNKNSDFYNIIIFYDFYIMTERVVGKNSIQ